MGLYKQGALRLWLWLFIWKAKRNAVIATTLHWAVFQSKFGEASLNWKGHSCLAKCPINWCTIHTHDTEIQLQERDTTCCLAKCPISQYQRGLWVDQVGRDPLMTIFDILKLVLLWNLLFSMSENCIFSSWSIELSALATLWVSLIKSDIIGFNLTVHFRSLLVDCNWIYWTLVRGVACRNLSM